MSKLTLVCEKCGSTNAYEVDTDCVPLEYTCNHCDASLTIDENELADAFGDAVLSEIYRNFK